MSGKRNLAKDGARGEAIVLTREAKMGTRGQFGHYTAYGGTLRLRPPGGGTHDGEQHHVGGTGGTLSAIGLGSAPPFDRSGLLPHLPAVTAVQFPRHPGEPIEVQGGGLTAHAVVVHEVDLVEVEPGRSALRVPRA
jgi:hypothetical protein